MDTADIGAVDPADIGAVDPAIQWAGGYVLWILLSNRLVDIGLWILLYHGPVDMCCESCYPIGW
jgi:hypothetical protein